MSKKVEEARLRRIALRRGYELHKSRRRDPKAYDYGKYVLYPWGTEGTWDSPAGGPDAWLTIDQVRNRLEVIRKDEQEFDLWASIVNWINRSETLDELRWKKGKLEEHVQEIDRIIKSGEKPNIEIIV